MQQAKSSISQENWLQRLLCYQCDACLDTNLVIRQGQITQCDQHALRPNATADQLLLVVNDRLAAEKLVNYQVFETARALVHSSISRPVPLFCLQNHLQVTDRAVKGFIESLRREWLLPIGSSKEPGGYYWIRSAAEMTAWLTAFLSQPKSEFRTAYKMVNANFPELAGQLKFDYETEGSNG